MELTLWAFHLDAIDADSISAVLSNDERERAGRFRFEIHRQRFIAARGALRTVLAEVTGAMAEALEFEYGEHGKPRLKGLEIEFNLSHSANWALIGVGPAAIGVDIEKVNPDRSEPGIARRFFADREIAALDGLPGEGYAKAFFNCWSRKEAVLKAVGTGISGGLSSFAVPIGGMDTPEFISPPGCTVWNLAALFPYLEVEGFSTAAAMLGEWTHLTPVCGRVLRIPVRRTLK